MIEYKAIKEIEQNPSHTLRSLAGQIEKGMVKEKK
jgi:hypothetical protein